jgi:DNA-binding CsgD family transcriptional regulator/tetratricopeptide (TPR) repeat protein
VATRSSPITFGREADLARLDRARELAAEGRPVFAIVRGEAGIGKTRLVADAIDRATRAGSPILHGACLDLEGEPLPYLPFVEALRTLVQSMPADRLRAVLGPAGPDLAPLVPEIATLHPAGGGTPAAADGSMDSSVDRARLFERFLGFLERLGEDQPVVAVLEDVQWIDPATRDLVTFLVRNVTKQRLVAILTCRTDDLTPGHPVRSWLAELGRAPGAIGIELRRLTQDDVLHQLEAMSEGPLPGELFDSIWRRSEGHPLFVEELLAAHADPAATFARPPSLIDLLLTRVASLEPATLTIVRILALAGRPIDERLIAPLVGRSPGEIGDALREATVHGVLAALPDGRHGFRHELIRELVERDLTISERRELHEGFARELEAHPELADQRQADATAELARHWAAADRPVEAHSAALRAASAAEEVHAYADAHRQFERAIALEERLPHDALPPIRDRIEIRRRAASDADLGGSLERGIALIRAALEMATTTADPTLSGLLHQRLGYLTWASGDGEAALLEHRRAVELIPADPPSTERATVLAALGGALMGLGRWAESRPICTAAIDCAIASGAAPEESRARTMLGSDLVALGEIEAGLEELRKAHRLAGDGATELSVVTGHNLALNLLATDRLEEGLAVATRSRSAARDAGLDLRHGMELAALVGDILSRLGRWDEADQATGEGLRLDQRGHGTPYLAAVRARLVARRGDVGDARRRLAAIPRETLEPDLAAFVAIVSAEISLIDGRPTEALETVLDAIDAFAASGDVLWGVPLVALGLRAGAELAESLRADQDEAGLADLRQRIELTRTMLTSLPPRLVTPGAQAWLATAAAEAGRLDGVIDPQPWIEAVAAWDAAGDPAEGAYVRYRAAETALRKVGVKAAVGPELIAAWRTATRLRAVWLREAIETLARRARIALVMTPAPGGAPESDEPASRALDQVEPGRIPVARKSGSGHGLSAREIEVLRLVAAGRSNGEIGDELFITRKTAGVHVTHILDKLGVSNRVEAAMAAARLGLIDADVEREPHVEREPMPRLR